MKSDQIYPRQEIINIPVSPGLTRSIYKLNFESVDETMLSMLDNKELFHGLERFTRRHLENEYY